MKTKGKILISLGILAVVLIYFSKNFHSHPSRQPLISKTNHSAKNSATNSRNLPHSFTLQAKNMTALQKKELAKKFTDKFQPAVKKWFEAYGNHIPFDQKDFTLDKFHSRLGNYLYTFMINPDTTFTLQDPKDPTQAAKVVYLMSRKAAIKLNQLPNGTAPDFSIPITRKEIIQMVKADCGVEFKPNEVIIRPTAESSALNGGVSAALLPSGKDPNNGLNYKITVVFNSSGKLVSYDRDPFF